MTRIKRISVIGLGKLGAPMAAIFASKGYRVVGVDLDEKKLQAIRSRVAPVEEPGLGQLLRKGKLALEATKDIAYAVRETDVTFIVVATPSEPSGGFSIQYVLAACVEIGAALREKDWHIVAVTSTVMPGATDGPIRAALERESGKRAGRDFGLCYNPEFIALGTVIRDFQAPDFVLIGESDADSGVALAALYTEVCSPKPTVARMTSINAEIAKLAVNTYITTKISYANMLANICERIPGANVDTVTRAIGLDSRIGGKYLKGAVAYGGPCFPRDNRALAAVAADAGVCASLAEAVDLFNRDWVHDLAERIEGFGHDNRIGILGLTYKLDTNITEEAAGRLLANELNRRGLTVFEYDPAVPVLGTSAERLVEQSDVIVVTLPHPEFALPVEHWRGKTVIDCWRSLGHLANQEGITYIPLGVGPCHPQP